MNKQPARLGNARRARIAFRYSAAAFLAAVVTAPLVQAQEQASGVVTLETLTVEARHVGEAIEDVPFTVTVIDGERIEKQRQRSIEQVLEQTPGVDVISGITFGDSVRIRGVGTLGRTTLDDNSVIIHMNGMPQSMLSLNLDMLDVESVEVLKGPQGTLFGRGSEGGAINIRSRKPTRFFEAYVNGEIGQEDQRMVTGAISGPISDTLSGRFAARYWGADGVITNVRDGDPLTTPEDVNLRGTLLWQAAESTEVTLVAGHERDEAETFAILLPFGSEPEDDVPPGSRFQETETTRLTGEVVHDFDSVRLTSMTGHVVSDFEFQTPVFPQNIMQRQYGFQIDTNFNQTVDEELFNQELRLSSRPGDEIFWVVGANYYQADRDFHVKNISDAFFPANPFNADIVSSIDVDSYAVFGEVTYPLTDALKATLGLRHTWDDKSLDAVWTANPTHPAAGMVNTDSQSLKDDYTTGRAALNYAVFDGLNVYGVYARGYKSGGWFDTVGSSLAQGLAEPVYDAAVVDSYEVGFKYFSPNGGWRLSGAVFFNDTRDDHLAVLDTNVFLAITENFDTETKGAELELGWEIGDGVSLTGGLAYMDSTIVAVPATTFTNATEGDRVPGVSEWSGSVSLNYETNLSAFLGMSSPQLLGTLSNRYVGERAADVGENFRFPSYNKLDARIGIQARSTEVYLWGDNLLDEHYDTGISFYFPAVPPAFGGTGLDAAQSAPARGRTFGIGMKHEF